MFAGIMAILLNETQNVISGIASKAGEEVQFVMPLSLVSYPCINDWLSHMEHQMQVSFAMAVAKVV